MGSQLAALVGPAPGLSIADRRRRQRSRVGRSFVPRRRHLALLTQSQREDGIGYDFEDQANDKNDIRAGAQYDVNTSSIYQIVPTVPQIVTAAPRLNQYLVYVSDTWSITPAFSAMGSLRYVGQHSQTSDNPPVIYGDGAIDPHLALAYTFAGLNGLRATFDHNSGAAAAARSAAHVRPGERLQRQLRRQRQRRRPQFSARARTADDYAFSYERGAERKCASPTSRNESRTSSTFCRPTIAMRSTPAKTPMRSVFPPTPASCARMGWSSGSATATLRSTPTTITRSLRASISSRSTISTRRRFSPAISSRPTIFRTSPRWLRTSSLSCIVACACADAFVRKRLPLRQRHEVWDDRPGNPGASPQRQLRHPGSTITS